MNKQNVKRLLTLPRQAKQATYPILYQSQPDRSRKLFLTFCTALLLESIVLQVATTLDGSEIAFNPSPKAAASSNMNEAAIGQVSGVQIERSQKSSSSPTPSPTPTPNQSRMSLVTQAQAAPPPAPLTSPSLLFRLPLRSFVFTQYYSSYHPAVDMASPQGTPIYATADGVVAGTGYLMPGGGLMVQVDHGGGYMSYYAHMSAITSQVGQRVNNSTQIGQVGATGWATGAHLHFMIWKDGQALNPLNLTQ